MLNLATSFLQYFFFCNQGVSEAWWSWSSNPEVRDSSSGCVKKGVCSCKLFAKVRKGIAKKKKRKKNISVTTQSWWLRVRRQMNRYVDSFHFWISSRSYLNFSTWGKSWNWRRLPTHYQDLWVVSTEFNLGCFTPTSELIVVKGFECHKDPGNYVVRTVRVSSPANISGFWSGVTNHNSIT